MKPERWILKKLQLQKASLAGSAEKLYDTLTPNSGWLGGNGKGWEKGPYYVKGPIALAYTRDDRELKNVPRNGSIGCCKAKKPNRSFGPVSNDDCWPWMVVIFYLRRIRRRIIYS